MYPALKVIGAGLVLIMIYRGTFQNAAINAYFCLLGLLCIPHLYFNLTTIRKTNLNYIHVLCILSIVIQFLSFSSTDGRPSLAYQMNLSGAYLFLFFIASDVLKNQHGKLLVIILSLFTIIRLLIFSIVIFYLVRFLKKYFRSRLQNLNATRIIISSYIVLSIFSVWYVINIKSKISSDNNISRIATINDGSNEFRFLANTVAMATIYTDPLNANILFGFGDIKNYIKATNPTLIMPHNELYDGIVEFGIVIVIFFSLFSLPVFSKITSYSNIEYLIPVLFHTLLLWVRFLIIPSFEMLFILFLMNIVYQRNESRDKGGSVNLSKSKI